MVDPLILRERQHVVRAVHRRRRRVDEMANAGMPAAFQHVAERDQIVANVRVRRDQRMANAGLRGEMHDGGWRLRAKQLRAGVGDRQVGARKREVRVSRERSRPRLLQGDVVIRIEVVDADDVGAAFAERARDVHADEAGGTGHDNALARERGGRREAIRAFAHGSRPAAPNARHARARGASRA